MVQLRFNCWLLQVVRGIVLAVLGVVRPRRAGERVALRRPRVVVLRVVGDDEQAWVCPATLHLLPRRASFRAAAPVVPSEQCAFFFFRNPKFFNTAILWMKKRMIFFVYSKILGVLYIFMQSIFSTEYVTTTSKTYVPRN